MLTAHPTLLIGPADWQPERMPETEFNARIETLWQSVPEAERVFVYGTPRHHAELAYLTNLVPKLEPALALFSRTELPRLLVGGGPNMLGASRPLTWLSNVAPLRAMDNVDKSNGVLIGGGYMTTATRRAFGEMPDATPLLWTQMRRKSSFELAAIGEACMTLSVAMAAVTEAQRAGSDVTGALLAGERAANSRGAQDVRALFSVDGGRTLQPFEMLISRTVDPLQIYLAVRHYNYWAEGFALLSRRPSPIAETAAALLRDAIAALKPGASAAAMARIIETGRGPYGAHAVTDDAWATSLGLALEEPPFTDLGTIFETGEVYSLKIGLTDNADQNAIVSAIVAVREGGSDVLWTAG
jgi:Xaa-Pro aminopeptidase